MLIKRSLCQLNLHSSDAVIPNEASFIGGKEKLSEGKKQTQIPVLLFSSRNKHTMTLEEIKLNMKCFN
jgi:hypothetical protein